MSALADRLAAIHKETELLEKTMTDRERAAMLLGWFRGYYKALSDVNMQAAHEQMEANDSE